MPEKEKFLIKRKHLIRKQDSQIMIHSNTNLIVEINARASVFF